MKKTVKYLLYCLAYAFVSVLWYNNVFFKCILEKTFIESCTVFWLMTGLSVVICAFTLNRYMITTFAAAIAIIIPLGLYTILAYWQTVAKLILTILIASAIFSILFFAYMWLRKTKYSSKKRAPIKAYVKRCLKTVPLLLTITMLVVISTIGIGKIVGDGINNSTIRATTVTDNMSQTISNNIDTILLLQEDKWCTLTTQKKLDVLQTVANIEARYLGLPHELNVVTNANINEPTLAYYDDSTHTINIDIEHIENDTAYDCLITCCHEAHHSLQYRLIDAYDTVDERLKELYAFKPVIKYKREFSNYISSSNGDYWAYYEQKCEIDARDYAKEAVDDYYNRIDNYLANDSLEDEETYQYETENSSSTNKKIYTIQKDDGWYLIREPLKIQVKHRNNCQDMV